MEALSDNALMLKVKENDLDKLSLLYERYKGQLFGFFFNMNRDRDVSEDLVQNVFMRVIKYKHSFRADGEFRTWLFHVARNVNYDHHKKVKKMNAESIDPWEEQLAEDENTSQDKEYELQLLEEAMDMLDYEKKELLVLSKLKGVKYKEVGDILGCSEGAVKTKVFRALKDLRKEYELLAPGING